jgi:hypothetical protein
MKCPEVTVLGRRDAAAAPLGAAAALADRMGAAHWADAAHRALGGS